MVRRAAPIAFLLAALSQPAAAAAQDCRFLRTVAAQDPAVVRTLRLGYEPGAGISFWIGRVRADLAPASTCELDAASEFPSFDCRWRFGAHAEAVAFLEPLLAQARSCLESHFPAGDHDNAASAWTVMRSNRAELIAGDDDSDPIEVTVELVESSHPDRVNYYVVLRVDR